MPDMRLLASGKVEVDKTITDVVSLVSLDEQIQRLKEAIDAEKFRSTQAVNNLETRLASLESLRTEMVTTFPEIMEAAYSKIEEAPVELPIGEATKL
jgi:hypothetical protein